ncbi:hypothetical protein A2U01_0070357, partial [Trifolium medium]|nr:hypothetical protein [Trifolium medium]
MLVEKLAVELAHENGVGTETTEKNMRAGKLESRVINGRETTEHDDTFVANSLSREVTGMAHHNSAAEIVLPA